MHLVVVNDGPSSLRNKAKYSIRVDVLDPLSVSASVSVLPSGRAGGGVHDIGQCKVYPLLYLRHLIPSGSECAIGPSYPRVLVSRVVADRRCLCVEDRGRPHPAPQRHQFADGVSRFGVAVVVVSIGRDEVRGVVERVSPCRGS